MSVLAGLKALLLGGGDYLIQRSVRLRSSASAYFNRTFTTPTDGKKFTVSMWLKRGAITARQRIFYGIVSNYFGVEFSDGAGGNGDNLYIAGEGVALSLKSTAVYRDPSAWYHIVVVYDSTNATQANRVVAYVNNVQVTFTGTNTLALNTTSSLNANGAIVNIGSYNNGVSPFLDGYLTEINFIDGQALTPSSFGETDSITGVWKPKKYAGTYGTNGFYLPFTDNTLNTLLSNSGNISAPYGGVATNALVADGVYCTSNVSAGSSFTFLLNTFASATQVTRYSITNLSFTGGASTFSIQSSPDNSTWTTLATLSVTASNQSFSGSLNGYAKYFRIAPTAFGTNGSASVDAFLLYADGLGLDASGNGNNWTPNNISVTAGVTYDSMIDVPTPYADGGNGRGNYATLNPLNSANLGSGNLQVTGSGAGDNHVTTIAIPTTGKWYCEMSSTAYNASTIVGWFGVANASGTNFSGLLSRVSGAGAGFFQNDSLIASTNIGALNTIFGIAVDRGANTVTIYLNNVAQATVPTLATGVDLFFYYGTYTSGTGWVNFGQRPFSYTPPTGFKALNTFNLPDATIKKGNLHFDAVLNSGNGTSRFDPTNFAPDLVWSKSRSAVGFNIVQDTVRGAGNRLITDTTNAELFDSTYGTFASNGFNFGSNANINTNGVSYVDWFWNAGGNTVSNTSGSITSSVRANPTAGISVVNFTGMPTSAGTSTIGHGLGVAPSFFMIKNRDLADNWYGYHVSLGTSAYISLNLTAAQVTGASMWGPTAPTSSVFTLRNTSLNTTTAQRLVAYCFAEVAGFSKFGSYVGNGSVDGPFLYCGFRPRFILIKDYGNPASNWIIHDTARNTFNQAVNTLSPNSTAAEATYGSSYGIDVLSNGFKIRLVGSPLNTTNDGVLYAAFAENPFKNALAR